VGKSAVLVKLAEFLDDPYRKLGEQKDTCREKAIGYLVPGVPAELIHAAGLLPVALLGSSKPISKADTHLTLSTCSPVRSNLEMALDGELDFLDGVVLNHMCECVRSAALSWYDIFPTPFFDVVSLPKKLNGSPVVRERFTEELSRFRASLENFSGQKISDDRLKESIHLYNQGREALRSLYDISRNNPQLVTSRDVFTAIKSSLLMPKEEHNRLLHQLLSELGLEKADKTKKGKGVRLILDGHMVEPLGLLDIIEEVGGHVVGDNLATGSRCIAKDISLDGDPLEAIIDQHLTSPPFSGYYDPRLDRAKFLLDLVEKSHANGVIFLIPYQCDPYIYDYPDLKKALSKADVSNLMIQTELSMTSFAQVRTRLQAFTEIVRGGGIFV
jgi:benzoyl-CoA reductase subunit C